MAFIDARDLPEATEIDADLIIIGGGMAGIAIAKEWAGLNKSVAIIESGGREMDRDLQQLNAGAGVMRGPGNPDLEANDYLIASRFRGLGGAGNVWGGKLVPLDESDFAPRDWLPLSGWPMSRAQMQPYYERACRLYEIPQFDVNNAPPREEGRPVFEMGGDFFSAPRCFTRFSGAADRAAFDEFRTSFADAANISVYLNANVVEFARNRRGNVTGVKVACLNGRHHTARGRAYVLATGGVENARLMLANGIGNDWVGRCFQGHVNYGKFDAPEGRNSSMCVSDGAASMGLYTNNDRDKIHCVLANTLDGQRRGQTVNFTVTLYDETADLTPDVAALMRAIGAIDRGGGPARNLTIYFKTEQLPNPESRIVLDDTARDALGMPRVRLDWRFTDMDFDKLDASIAQFANTLGAAGLGRVCWPVAREHYLSIMTPARHHMGTTRMHVDPEYGVVDQNCRVHGMRNLYVAGSSVFPTSGNANPTLTLAALAMRLSDHLKQRLGARS
ncbi:glucose-methanol-choline (GMC) oxidoreductase:NAD binding site [alpha proteobacterium U9-1i]|nr:glucose-methanol-choline (GMC) oxidoreductase:NAD binding site [alpha proteobacterium U9-1i]